MLDFGFYNMDCMEGMGQFPDNYFDLALVDPPYGIGADKAQNAAAEQRIKANGRSKAGRGWKSYKETNWDKETPKCEYWNMLKNKSKRQVVWGGNYFIDNLYPTMGWIVWDKGQRGFSLADGELAWTSFDKALRIFSVSRGRALAENNKTGGRFHPTQKPIELYRWVLKEYAQAGWKILDTHVGSASSLIACEWEGFDYVGFEIDADYYAAAMKRIENWRKSRTLDLFKSET